MDAKGNMRIAVIGAGMMGQGIAQAFAMAGHEVMLESLDDELFRTVLDRIRADLLFLADRGLGSRGDVELILSRITTTSDLAEALVGVDFVLETIWEDLEAKRAVFREIEALVDSDTVIATNTSVIRITEIAEVCIHPERVIGAHWWNPASLVPLVEIVPGERTSERTIRFTTELMLRAGKRPVFINKDAPGFVGNRLLHALYREAIWIVEQGIADPATVDEVFKYGPGMRFPVLAPFEHLDMVGLNLGLAVQDYMLPFLADSHTPSPLLQERVRRGECGFRTGGVGFRTWTLEEQRALREGLMDFLAHRITDPKQAACAPLT